VAARDESGGLIEAVTDKEIVAAYRLLAEREGVFAEPASAASVAGLLKLARRNYFRKASVPGKTKKIVCILTGHGLKDPDRAIHTVKKPFLVKPRMKDILKHIGL